MYMQLESLLTHGWILLWLGMCGSLDKASKLLDEAMGIALFLFFKYESMHFGDSDLIHENTPIAMCFERRNCAIPHGYEVGSP